mmetsp:Transcript_86302/g.172696  ORF Transcript_86302/g.172696 Transcript_86302/m.172696 type:complete len:315 (+) Transcript_86302:255-1199(+)
MEEGKKKSRRTRYRCTVTLHGEDDGKIKGFGPFRPTITLDPRVSEDARQKLRGDAMADFRRQKREQEQGSLDDTGNDDDGALRSSKRRSTAPGVMNTGPENRPPSRQIGSALSSLSPAASSKSELEAAVAGLLKTRKAHPEHDAALHAAIQVMTDQDFTVDFLSEALADVRGQLKALLVDLELDDELQRAIDVMQSGILTILDMLELDGSVLQRGGSAASASSSFFVFFFVFFFLLLNDDHAGEERRGPQVEPHEGLPPRESRQDRGGARGTRGDPGRQVSPQTLHRQRGQGHGGPTTGARRPGLHPPHPRPVF